MVPRFAGGLQDAEEEAFGAGADQGVGQADQVFEGGCLIFAPLMFDADYRNIDKKAR